LALQANTRVFDLFHAEIVADGRVPLIVLLPSAGDVEQRVKGLSDENTPLTDHFEKKGYLHFDFLDTLENFYEDELSVKSVFVRTHPNGAANKLLAEEIIETLPL
jgi:hypothetical protein